MRPSHSTHTRRSYPNCYCARFSFKSPLPPFLFRFRRHCSPDAECSYDMATYGKGKANESTTPDRQTHTQYTCMYNRETTSVHPRARPATQTTP